MRIILFVFFIGISIVLYYKILGKKSTTRIFCCVAGRSGGHIVPGVTLMQEYAKKSVGQILFFSTATELDQTILQHYTFIDYYVPLALDSFPKRSFMRLCLFIGQFCFCFVKSVYYLLKLRPEKIVSMGGYISIPVCYAGWLLRIPFELFELNAVPGQATLFLSKRAAKIHICFPQAAPYFKHAQVQLHEYPLRFTQQDKLDKEVARKHLGITTHKKIVLVLGGSQGSEFINTLVMRCAAAQLFVRDNWFILHQTGAGKLRTVIDFYAMHAINARVFDYSTDMHLYYAAADLVITRAGAGTLFELLFFKKPALLIPLETKTTDHQKSNAHAFADVYAQLYTVIEQSQLERNPDLLVQKLKQSMLVNCLNQ